MTIFHLRDLAANKKQRIKCTEVKHINVPQFEGLSIDDMLDWACMHGYVLAALPELERERKKLPRSYIANVCNTIEGESFSKWVNKRVEERHNKR